MMVFQLRDLSSLGKIIMSGKEVNNRKDSVMVSLKELFGMNRTRETAVKIVDNPAEIQNGELSNRILPLHNFL